MEQALPFLEPWSSTLMALLLLVLFHFCYDILYDKISGFYDRKLGTTDTPDYLQEILEAVKSPLKLLLEGWILYFAVNSSPLPLGRKLQLLDKLIRSVGIYAFFWGFFNMTNANHGLLLKVLRTAGIKIDSTLSNILSTCLHILICIIGMTVMAKEWDFDITGLLASLSIGSLALALAAKDALANVFGSLIIVLEKPFKPGDWISANGVEGTVEKITFRSTWVRTFPQELIFIPNSTLSSTAITNYSLRQKRRLDFTLGFTYDSSREALESFMGDLKHYLENRPDILTTNGDIVQVNFAEYNSSSLDIRTICYVNTDTQPKFLAIASEINLDLLELISRNGLSCAFPSTSIYMEKK